MACEKPADDSRVFSAATFEAAQALITRPTTSKQMFGKWGIPANQVVWETKLWYSTLSYKPFRAGHLLLIPKDSKIASLRNLDDELLEDMSEHLNLLLSMLQLLRKASCNSTGGNSTAATGLDAKLDVSVQDGVEAGQTVPHLHLHVIPQEGTAVAGHDKIGALSDEELANQTLMYKQLAYHLQCSCSHPGSHPGSEEGTAGRAMDLVWTDVPNPILPGHMVGVLNADGCTGSPGCIGSPGCTGYRACPKWAPVFKQILSSAVLTGDAPARQLAILTNKDRDLLCHLLPRHGRETEDIIQNPDWVHNAIQNWTLQEADGPKRRKDAETAVV